MALTAGLASAALAGTGVGATFNLGKTNAVNAVSKLVGSVAGPSLQIDNNSTNAAATALDLQVEPGKAPMKVNSSEEVVGLNVDQVDGQSAGNFLGRFDTASDSDLLDGKDSTAFATAVNGKATDADKLDGKSADQLVRVAFTSCDSRVSAASGTVATRTITTPASGFLVIDAGSDISNTAEGDLLECSIEVDNVEVTGSSRDIELNGRNDVNQQEDCSTNAAVTVSAGTHTVDLEMLGAGSNTVSGPTALSAIYIPFDGTGASPASTALSADPSPIR